MYLRNVTVRRATENRHGLGRLAGDYGSWDLPETVGVGNSGQGSPRSGWLFCWPVIELDTNSKPQELWMAFQTPR